MAMTAQRIVSADGHIDLPTLPADLFRAEAPGGLRERMPRVVEHNDGPAWVAEDGAVLARVGGIGTAGRPYRPGEVHRHDRMAAAGLLGDMAAGRMRPARPDLRAADQDLDGVAAEAVYGVLQILQKLAPDVAGATARIYNDFAAGFAAARPDRFATIASLPHAAPEDSAVELRRAAGLGLRGAELSLGHDLLPLWREEWEPLWTAAEEASMPLHLHTIGPPIDTRSVQTPRHLRSWLGTWLTRFQLQIVEHLGALVFGGVLDAHPGLRVVLGECGIGWIAYVLERMDLEWDEQFRDIGLSLPPSGLWQRQCFATFQVDRTGLALLDRVGPHTIMWGNDYPHGDGTWPDSVSIIDDQFAGVDEKDARLVLHDNAARLYRLDLG
jgi:predicted TIM-barrel fold metal-dependent hydrolase